MTKILRIAFVGAECSGKTSLAQSLTDVFSKEYPSAYVPEYLRLFVDQENRTPRPDEQVGIAQEQQSLERTLANDLIKQHANPEFVLLFCDTTPLMTCIYSEVVFGGTNPDLFKLAKAHDYDLTIFTQNDFPWQEDGLQRDGPVAQTKVHFRVKARLEELQIPYQSAFGDPGLRLQKTQDSVRALIEKRQAQKSI
jgi:nicotinamide riboside kinase